MRPSRLDESRPNVIKELNLCDVVKARRQRGFMRTQLSSKCLRFGSVGSMSRRFGLTCGRGPFPAILPDSDGVPRSSASPAAPA